MQKKTPDRGQTAFYDKEGELKITDNLTKMQIVMSAGQREFVCPYCLHIDKINNFLYSISGTVSKKLRHCPDCDNVMRVNTLTVTMTLKGYGEWLQSVLPWEGARKKLRMDTIKKRMRERGIAGKVWYYYYFAKYQQLPYEMKPDTFNEYYEAIRREKFEGV